MLDSTRVHGMDALRREMPVNLVAIAISFRILAYILNSRIITIINL